MGKFLETVATIMTDRARTGAELSLEQRLMMAATLTEDDGTGPMKAKAVEIMRASLGVWVAETTGFSDHGERTGRVYLGMDLAVEKTELMVSIDGKNWTTVYGVFNAYETRENRVKTEIMTMLRDDRVIDAIKRYRALTNTCLKDAKAQVDTWRDELEREKEKGAK